MGYYYDAFISYKRGFPFGTWVQETFLPLFEPLLTNALNLPSCNVFVDTDEILPGDAWPERLKNALAHSRSLVAIWSPSYFHSEWCKYEFSVMLERENLLGYRTDQNPLGLIIPVSVFDGEHFPIIAQRIQAKDFRAYARVGLGFQKTEKYFEFQNELFNWINQVAQVINQAPPWNENWISAPHVINPMVNSMQPLVEQPILE